MSELLEEWRPVVEWEDIYEVSNHGRVRSIARAVVRSNGTMQPLPRRLRKLQMDRNGRWSVMLCRDYRKQLFRVHRLVAMAFIGPPGPEDVVCHNNGDPSDNRVQNLRWGTPSANQMDRVAHGTHGRGERHNMVKLGEREVHTIRHIYGHGFASQRQIASKYGVSQSLVSAIVRRDRWGWLPDLDREVISSGG